MMEAEYITTSEAAKEAVWIRNFVSELSIVSSVSSPTDLYCDNSGAIVQAKEPRHTRGPNTYYSVTILSAKSLVKVM
jgi:hypothetical protein